MSVSIRRIVSNAIRKEEAAEQFYTKARDKARGPAARKLLGNLAREETKHADLLRGKNVRAFLATDPPPIRDLRIADFLAPRRISPTSSFADILIHAIKREDASFWAYRALADSADDGQMRKLFLRLAEEERRHRNRLEKLYDDVIFRED